MATNGQQRMVVLGVTGGIACYKAVELVRLLVKNGFKVRVIMTRSAMEFVTPLTFQTLSGNPVATETFSLTQESEIGHINLADSADLFVIAPTTANVTGTAAARTASATPPWSASELHPEPAQAATVMRTAATGTAATTGEAATCERRSCCMRSW